ncbi:MAG TPA: TIGR03435 family protein [Bryobacteraceae bacterium]|jgi:uncharacterized protein (TIGR03435 family)
MRCFPVAVVCLAIRALAQTASPSPKFEAVAIKPSAPSADGRIMVGIQGGPGTRNPGQMNFWNISLADLIQNAWDVKKFQVSAPDWLSSERFDIQAKIPSGATKDEGRLMIQNMLADRFKLALHRTTKESSIYALTIAKGGPKLKEAETGPGAQPKRMMTMNEGGRMKMDLKGATMSAIVDMLGLQLDRPVIDMTGLTGSYDVLMEFAPLPSPAATAPDPNSAPTIFSALTEQLGLKLEARKGPVETVVVDSMEKTPTEN